MTPEEMALRLVEIEQRSKSNTHQIGEVKDSIKELTESIQALNSLAVAVERIAVKQESISAGIASVEKDVKELKEKPAKRWDAVWSALIAALIGWALGHFA